MKAETIAKLKHAGITVDHDALRPRGFNSSKTDVACFFELYPGIRDIFKHDELPEVINHFRESASKYEMKWALEKLSDTVNAEFAAREAAVKAGTLPKPDYSQPNPPIWHIDTSRHKPAPEVLAPTAQKLGIVNEKSGIMFEDAWCAGS